MSQWQQVLAVDAKFNSYRAPDSPGFSKFFVSLFTARFTRAYCSGGNLDQGWQTFFGWRVTFDTYFFQL